MADQPRSTPPASQDPEAPAVRTSATLTQTTSYSGPLPPAAELQAYDDAVPGAAERIIRMAESYAGHTQELEGMAMKLEGAARRRGQWLGALVVFGVLGSCLYALHLDKETFAIALGTGTLVALAAVFVAGKVPEWFKKTES